MLFDVGRNGGSGGKADVCVGWRGKAAKSMPTQSPSHARQQLPKYVSAEVWQREAEVTRSAFADVPLALT